MFVYKYCPKCKKRNHKARESCIRCGDELTTGGRFGKDVFAITLSIVMLFFAATAFASKSYIDYKANKDVQPVTDAKTTEQTPTILRAPKVTTPLTTTPSASTQPAAIAPQAATTPKATTPAKTTTPSASTQPAAIAPQVATTPKATTPAKTTTQTDFSSYIPEINQRITICDVKLAGVDKEKKDLEALHNAEVAEINSQSTAGLCCSGRACQTCGNPEAEASKKAQLADADQRYLDAQNVYNTYSAAFTVIKWGLNHILSVIQAGNPNHLDHDILFADYGNCDD